jgi:hypothetical protein
MRWFQIVHDELDKDGFASYLLLAKKKNGIQNIVIALVVAELIAFDKVAN